jgi:hypothetical protein
VASSGVELNRLIIPSFPCENVADFTYCSHFLAQWIRYQLGPLPFVLRADILDQAPYESCRALPSKKDKGFSPGMRHLSAA